MKHAKHYKFQSVIDITCRVDQLLLMQRQKTAFLKVQKYKATAQNILSIHSSLVN